MFFDDLIDVGNRLGIILPPPATWQRYSYGEIQEEGLKELSNIRSPPLKATLEVRNDELILIYSDHKIGKFEFRHCVVSTSIIDAQTRRAYAAYAWGRIGVIVPGVGRPQTENLSKAHRGRSD